MKIFGETALLKILPFDEVLLHEKCDEERVEKLVGKLIQDKVLRNPLIVAGAEAEGKYIALDGANRYSALARIGCRHLLAQVVDYSAPGLELHTWFHLLRGADKKELLGKLEDIKEIKLSKIEPDRAIALLEESRNCGALLCEVGDVLLIEWDAKVFSLADALNRIIDIYKKRSEIERITPDQLTDLLSRDSFDNFIIVGYPKLSPKEIRQIALNRQKLPAGITKHVIPNRILRINFPLDVLKADIPPEEKNRILEKLVSERQKSSSIRYYAESVIIFDE